MMIDLTVSICAGAPLHKAGAWQQLQHSASPSCRASGTSAELIDSMREKVWLCQVPKNAVEKFMRAYKVANVKALPDGAELRIVSANRPTENAVEETATLEDVFLSYFGEKGESDNGSI